MNTSITPRPSSVGWRTLAAMAVITLATPLLWPGVVRNLFASSYMPHGHCYLWTRSLVSLHLVSDLLIGGAYVAISASLIYVVHRVRREIPFHWIILAFGVFIVACGATHFMEVWTIWNATYWLSGAVKMITATASVITALAMPIVVPNFLKLVGDARRSREHQRDLEVAHAELDEAYRKIQGADAVLRREHRYLAALLDGLDERVIVCDPKGRVMFANRPHETRAVAYQTLEDFAEDLEYRNPQTGRPIPYDDRPLVRALHGETVEKMLVEVRTRNTARRIALASAKPVFDEDGAPLGAMAVIRDITNERRAEQTIHELQRNTSAILEAAGEGICGIDMKGHTMLMNPAAEEISGWRLDDLSGRLRHAMVHHTRSDGTPYPWEECPDYFTLQDGKPRAITDDIFWRPDGTWFPVEYVVTPIYEDTAITGAVITFQDVTERKRLEQDLEQARRVESLGRLAATIAHEFNNVLMGIQPFIEVIGSRAPDNPDIRKSLNYIALAVQRGKRYPTRSCVSRNHPNRRSSRSTCRPGWCSSSIRPGRSCRHTC